MTPVFDLCIKVAAATSQSVSTVLTVIPFRVPCSIWLCFERCCFTISRGGIKISVQYLPSLSCMLTLAPRPRRKAHSSTLLIWAAKTNGVAPSWHSNINHNHCRNKEWFVSCKIQCTAYPVLDIQIGIKVPQDLSAGQTATDSCRG